MNVVSKISQQLTDLLAYLMIPGVALISTEFEQLQEALVSSDNNWQGSELLNSL